MLSIYFWNLNSNTIKIKRLFIYKETPFLFSLLDLLDLFRGEDSIRVLINIRQISKDRNLWNPKVNGKKSGNL